MEKLIQNNINKLQQRSNSVMNKLPQQNKIIVKISLIINKTNCQIKSKIFQLTNKLRY
jgi:HD-like signal output (HDOD) protein